MSAPHKNDIFGISTSRRIDWYIKIDIFRWGGEKGSPANNEINQFNRDRCMIFKFAGHVFICLINLTFV